MQADLGLRCLYKPEDTVSHGTAHTNTNVRKRTFGHKRRSDFANWIYALSEVSDQTLYSLSLIRVFAWRGWKSQNPRFLHADSEDAGETVRMRRLICFRLSFMSKSQLSRKVGKRTF